MPVCMLINKKLTMLLVLIFMLKQTNNFKYSNEILNNGSKVDSETFQSDSSPKSDQTDIVGFSEKIPFLYK